MPVLLAVRDLLVHILGYVVSIGDSRLVWGPLAIRDWLVKVGAIHDGRTASPTPLVSFILLMVKLSVESCVRWFDPSTDIVCLFVGPFFVCFFVCLFWDVNRSCTCWCGFTTCCVNGWARLCLWLRKRRPARPYRSEKTHTDVGYFNITDFYVHDICY